MAHHAHKTLTAFGAKGTYRSLNLGDSVCVKRTVTQDNRRSRRAVARSWGGRCGWARSRERRTGMRTRSHHLCDRRIERRRMRWLKTQCRIAGRSGSRR